MALIETTVTKEHDDELDSRVELTELGMQAMQMQRIENAMRAVGALVFEYDEVAEGWTLSVRSVRQTFEVHGTSLVDVLAQAAQVIEVQ
jgi:hypothetical protein